MEPGLLRGRKYIERSIMLSQRLPEQMRRADAQAYLRLRMNRMTWELSTWSLKIRMHAMAMPVRPYPAWQCTAIYKAHVT